MFGLSQWLKCFSRWRLAVTSTLQDGYLSRTVYGRSIPTRRTWTERIVPWRDSGASRPSWTTGAWSHGGRGRNTPAARGAGAGGPATSRPAGARHAHWL